MKSVYIIKPDGMQYREKIRAMITNAGLKIVDSKKIYLTPTALHLLYPDVSKMIMFIIMREILGQECEIGIVEGDNAIQKLVALCGENTNPCMCTEGTIRKTFANPQIFIPVGKQTFYHNVIHRSKNEIEVERDLTLYTQL